jgi:hypothetical protein
LIFLKDLRWWSKTSGIDMTMNWPVFEEFQPEIKSIANKKNSKAAAAGVADGVALTGVQYKITDDDVIPTSKPPASTQSGVGVTVTQITALQLTHSGT